MASKADDEQEQAWKREVGERLRLVTLVSGVAEDQEFAAQLGVPRNNWDNWRRGDIMLPVRIAWQLKRAFGCGLEWLYLGDQTANTVAFNKRLAQALRQPPAPDRRASNG